MKPKLTSGGVVTQHQGLQREDTVLGMSNHVVLGDCEDKMNQRIIFTGGSSSVGSHVIDALLDHGFEILNIDNRPLHHPRVRMLLTDTLGAGQVYNGRQVSEVLETLISTLHLGNGSFR